MREKKPEQLSIFDVMTDLEKPKDFYLPDSFKSSKRGIEPGATAFEKVMYTGAGEIKNNLYTIYVRRESCGENKNRFIVSVPAIDFNFGYNSLEKLLAEWNLKKEDLESQEFKI